MHLRSGFDVFRVVDGPLEVLLDDRQGVARPDIRDRVRTFNNLRSGFQITKDLVHTKTLNVILNKLLKHI